jgi:nitrate reductase beta subunit
MFGPGAKAAVEAYKNAPNDPDLMGLLALFGSTEQIVPRFRRVGDSMVGLSENGLELVRVPTREPAVIREILDKARGMSNINVP